MQTNQSKRVFHDDFSSYQPTETINANRLFACFNSWLQTSFHYSWKSERATAFPWRIIKIGNKQYFEQPENWPNVVVCNGDMLWRDYILKAELIPLSFQRCGILFRYVSSRENYYLSVEEGRKLNLYRRSNDKLITLSSSGCEYKLEKAINIEVEVYGEEIKIYIDKKLLIDVCDNSYPGGKIGLRTDGPARYGRISVMMQPDRYDDFVARGKNAASVLSSKQKATSPAKLVKSIPLEVQTDYLHIEDIDGDGKNEVIFIKQECLGPNNTQVSSFGVMDFNGNVLWQSGRPQENKYPIHADIAFNVGDIDGDGKKEVIITQHRKIKLLDASSGAIKNEIPTPGTEHEKNIIGDSFLIADLKGCGSKTDILLKDRYENIWAYDCNLNLLWHRQLNTGHYPRAADINGDGRDEIMAGYSMLTADGETMWTVPGADPLRNTWTDYPHSEHADSIWIGRFSEGKNARIQVAIAASDMGFLLLDAQTGELLCRDRCGHAQSLAVAKFRMGLEGYQFAVTTLWGNPGIVTFFDCRGNKLLSREMSPFSIIIPVNWEGNGEVHLFLPQHNTLYDKSLSPVLHFPEKFKQTSVKAAFHIIVRPIANDFLNIGRDQIVLSDGKNIEFYTADNDTLPIKMKHDVENFNCYGAFYLA